MQQLRQHIARVVPLTEEEFAVVLRRFSCQQFKRHHLLVQVGQPVKYNYFVVEGLLKLMYTDEAGKQHSVSPENTGPELFGTGRADDRIIQYIFHECQSLLHTSA
ncbi:hypothetical protein [Hymenobacter sp. YC55]|uniref:hypothetical protein n=1 Tax=Hymenobacter sp. YC55 TaxID=3034019 RepID=UPI0023F70962|nr:hypothetical protein [Hymenobacter sp. YC55]MDF7814218.1 hypothetical protein [Hymenobacter sp. YC55]